MNPTKSAGAPLRLIGLLAALALAACGGSRQTADVPAQAQSAQVSAVPAANYQPAVQQMYIAYFGRPADPGGLEWFSAMLSNMDAPAGIPAISARYASDARLRGLVDVFSQSGESAALYPGDDASVVNAIYLNLFNRAPDVPGRDFWMAALANGTLSRSGAAIAIMTGAQGNDATLVDLKTRGATQFTAALSNDIYRANYSGLPANRIARDMLATLNSEADLAAFTARLTAAIEYMSATVMTDNDATLLMTVARTETATPVSHSGSGALIACAPPVPLGAVLPAPARVKLNPVAGTAQLTTTSGDNYTGSYLFKDGGVTMTLVEAAHDPIGNGVYSSGGSMTLTGTYNFATNRIRGSFVDSTYITWTHTPDRLECASYGDFVVELIEASTN